MAKIISNALLFIVFIVSSTFLLNGCTTVVSGSDTIYTTAFETPGTYTVTNGWPNSRVGGCCNSSNVYYSECPNCASMTPSYVTQTTVSRSFVVNPQPPCPFTGTSYSTGCGGPVTTNYYGYAPTCVWGSSC